ncbi:uncharacterized protein LOC115743696 isoform X2 [Rhodamnia argentea]|uniref:Uncharacterized protein LOC115743696 isoform X2 n=1 Tax=Rhodamnia argentea TaxID=178133 RepID=A0ABM3HDR6_9MYRT|nr:uncharacterized protein LOC115743696 isoform X2 [Rhodamnia argentea]
MEAERKSGTRRRRKPLSDLTNAVSLSELEPPLKPSVPSAPKRIAPNPSSPGSALLPSTPSRPIASSSGHDVSGRSMFCATYNRRKPADKSKRKENAVGVPMTSSPARKIRNARNKLNDEGDGAGSKSCSIPNKRVFCQDSFAFKVVCCMYYIISSGFLSPRPLLVFVYLSRWKNIDWTVFFAQLFLGC